METILTKIQAFNAMRKFLEMYYERTSSDDVGSLLGDLQMLRDGHTADPAAWHDWMKAIDNATQKKLAVKG
jgi:hypothetical protein